jgi:DNA-binding beta-propeller fold protein YncE
MVLEPLLGSGRVELSVRWPADGVLEPAVTATLSRGEEVRTISLECGDAACSGTLPDVPSGYHVLTVALFDGEERVTGTADAVRVLAGEATSLLVDFSSERRVFRGDIAVSLLLDANPPIDVVITGVPPTVYPGELIAPTVENAATPTAWFVDGLPVDGGGFLVPGKGDAVRITAISELDDRAGSTSIVVAIGDGSPIGGLVYNDTAGGDELPLSSPQSVALTRRHLYFSDYERGQSWRVPIDTASGTVDGALELLAEEFALLRSVPAGPGAEFTAGPAASGERVVWLVSNSVAHRYGPEGTKAVAAPEGGFAVSDAVVAADDDTAFVLSGQSMHEIGVARDSLTVRELVLPTELEGREIRAADLGGSGELYVADFSGDRLVGLRETVDGFIAGEELTDDVDGVVELNGASGALVIGRDLYACSYYDGAFLWFREDAESGQFVPQEAFPDVVPGATGLAASPGGDYVYATAGTGDSLAVFRRNVDTGAVTLDGVFAQHGGMDSPRAVSSIGDLVVIASANSRSIEVLREYRTATVE